MKFAVTRKPITQIDCDVLIVSTFERAKKLSGAAEEIDAALDGGITALIAKEKFEGKLGQTADFTPCGRIKAGRVILVGLGKEKELDTAKVKKAAASAFRKACELKAAAAAIVPPTVGQKKIDAKSTAQLITEGAILGTYKFEKHKTKNGKPVSIKRVEIAETSAKALREAKEGIRRGTAIAEAVCTARDLVNEPANIVTPSYLAEQAKSAAKELGFECSVFGRSDIEKMGMNLILAVAKGSHEEPKFIVMRYSSPEASKTIAIVGKGITFDAGGLNLKPSAGLDGLKNDMAGAAAVLAAMKAIAILKPKVNVIGLIPAAENLPGGGATKPGDVVTGLSGKSVEINNTDAEGRLLLADAVAYAEQQGVDQIIDLATLTGACIVALGRSIAGVFGDQKIVDKLIAAGEECGEKLWQLPLHPEYEESVNSDFADMKNAANEAGAITGALFIKRHIKKTPWAHIDIAGPASSDKDSGFITKGGTGFGVATILNYLEQI